MSRRGRTEIVRDILELCRTPVKKTVIVSQCNLNFKIIKRYLAYCFSRGWLVTEMRDKRTLYTTTDSGKDNLNAINEHISLMQF